MQNRTLTCFWPKRENTEHSEDVARNTASSIKPLGVSTGQAHHDVLSLSCDRMKERRKKKEANRQIVIQSSERKVLRAFSVLSIQLFSAVSGLCSVLALPGQCRPAEGRLDN